ncbi:hypothetical protein [Dermatobacter hominis]|uniref:hypothetical protein n=1 Tax=Dermatobacter hominis TaxID=2884263 RepID=UPI001D12543B|nr:hypothetical protein [Dermatobacter hominis]UDY33946.1 hypothetical protein LH044_11370 [Dermatobacter hominis]
MPNPSVHTVVSAARCFTAEEVAELGRAAADGEDRLDPALDGKLLGTIQQLIIEANTQCFHFDLRYAVEVGEPARLVLDEGASSRDAGLGMDSQHSTRKLTGLVGLGTSTARLVLPAADKVVEVFPGSCHLWPSYVDVVFPDGIHGLSFHAFGPAFR